MKTGNLRPLVNATFGGLGSIDVKLLTIRAMLQISHRLRALVLAQSKADACTPSNMRIAMRNIYYKLYHPRPLRPCAGSLGHS